MQCLQVTPYVVPGCVLGVPVFLVTTVGLSLYLDIASAVPGDILGLGRVDGVALLALRGQLIITLSKVKARRAPITAAQSFTSIPLHRRNIDLSM